MIKTYIPLLSLRLTPLSTYPIYHYLHIHSAPRCMLKFARTMAGTATPIKIGTHNGHFHADEALAVFLLRLIPRFKSTFLLRSRNPILLDECDYIVDVKGIYDGTRHFDHHQREFTETFSPKYSTKLSSAGLIYKHFAHEIITSRYSKEPSDPSVELIYDKVYEEFIEALDANDNGISAYPDDIKPKFNTRGISLPSIIGGFNPNWNEPVSEEREDDLFEEASTFIGNIFLQKLDYYTKTWLPARELVISTLGKRKEIDSSGKIMLFSQAVPWKDHLFGLEEELKIPDEEKPLYVLYPEGRGRPTWRIQAVPVSKDSFESRKSLPEIWRGVRDQQLSSISGINGGIFVHASGFIGGNSTYEGALKMAKKALEL